MPLYSSRAMRTCSDRTVSLPSVSASLAAFCMVFCKSRPKGKSSAGGADFWACKNLKALLLLSAGLYISNNVLLTRLHVMPLF